MNFHNFFDISVFEDPLCSEVGFSLQGIAVKIKRSLQGSPVENTHKMLRIWMGKKRSGEERRGGGIPFYRVGISYRVHVVF